MTENDASSSLFLPQRSIIRAKGKVAGLGAVDAFDDAYDRMNETDDTGSLTHDTADGSWEVRSLDGNESVSTLGSASSGSKSKRKKWKNDIKKGFKGTSDQLTNATNPWKELKQARKELVDRLAELDAERIARCSLETELAECKLLLAKAKEEKDEYVIAVQRANDERDLWKVTSENRLYQLMQQLKSSEDRRKALERRLQQGGNRMALRKWSRRSATDASTFVRDSQGDRSPWKLRFGRRNANQGETTVLPVDCVVES